MKKQYNIVEVKSSAIVIDDEDNPRYCCYDSILLVEGGEFTDTAFSKPAVRTNFNKIVATKRKRGLELIFKTREDCLIGYDTFGEEECSVDGYVFTLNEKPFEDEESARLFFELC